jgi:hypothetical protein
MAEENRRHELSRVVLGAVRSWTSDCNEETVAAIKGENQTAYLAQEELVARVVAAVIKLDQQGS